MRIGMLTQWFAPEPGGAIIPSVLADGFAKRGHHVRVLTGFPNYPTGEIHAGYRQRLRHVEVPHAGVTVKRVPLYPSHDHMAVQRLANYASFAASAWSVGTRHLATTDALWVYNSPGTVGPVANAVRRRHRVPFLLHVMDVWPDSVLDSGMVGGGPIATVARRSLAQLVTRTYEGAAAVAVTSPGQLDLLRSRGVPIDRLHYAPIWVDESIFHPMTSDRALLGDAVADASLVLMYAGAIGHVQGLETAVRAVAGCVKQGVHLVLIGSGVAERPLKELATSLGASNVHFLGRRPPNEMGALSSAADLQLVSLADTPLLRVTMPSKLQSILALGKPVIATAAGDAAEVVRQSGAGIVVNPGDVAGLADALVALAGGSPAQLRSWGDSGRSYYVREFAQQAGIPRVEGILQSIAR